jgi:hypothetical protein
MQTLGISESTPRTESWIKSLFWPSITSSADVDYLGVQGLWVCTIVAGVSTILLLLIGTPLIALAILAFFLIGGFGVREHSRFAAAIMLAYYALDVSFSGVSVIKVIFLALFISNVRATWIASQWKPDSEEAAPQPRLNDTFVDKFTDRLPALLWPKVRMIYYVYSVAFIAFMVVGYMAMALRKL